MPYKGGTWGELAKSRSKKRIEYFKRYQQQRRPIGRLGTQIPESVNLKSFLDTLDLKCQLCEKDSRLLIHHKDENMTNNNFRNLMLLCRGCHNRVHIRRRKECD